MTAYWQLPGPADNFNAPGFTCGEHCEHSERHPGAVELSEFEHWLWQKCAANRAAYQTPREVEFWHDVFLRLQLRRIELGDYP